MLVCKLDVVAILNINKNLLIGSWYVKIFLH